MRRPAWHAAHAHPTQCGGTHFVGCWSTPESSRRPRRSLAPAGRPTCAGPESSAAVSRTRTSRSGLQGAVSPPSAASSGAHARRMIPTTAGSTPSRPMHPGCGCGCCGSACGSGCGSACGSGFDCGSACACGSGFDCGCGCGCGLGCDCGCDCGCGCGCGCGSDCDRRGRGQRRRPQRGPQLRPPGRVPPLVSSAPAAQTSRPAPACLHAHAQTNLHRQLLSAGVGVPASRRTTSSASCSFLFCWVMSASAPLYLRGVGGSSGRGFGRILALVSQAIHFPPTTDPWHPSYFAAR